MKYNIIAALTPLALVVVACGGADVIIDRRGGQDGGVTDASTTDATPTPTPSGPTTRIEIRCPASDTQCASYLWYGRSKSATGRNVFVADLDRGELCTWGLDVNAQRGGSGGAWYDTLSWLLQLNPVYVNGNAVNGSVVTDSYGTNLNLTKSQLGCP